MLKTIYLSLLLAITCCISPAALAFKLAFIPDSQMREMGTESYAEIKKKTPASSNSKAKQRVECVANALTKRVGGQWEVTLFKGDEANAFALPGNKIGVYEGLLKIATTPDQLAVVIGHEIGHVEKEHANQRVSTSVVTSLGMSAIQGLTGFGKSDAGMAALGMGAQFGVLLPFSRNHESQADKYGIRLMAGAGFNPASSVALWQKMKQANGKAPPELLSTHPSNNTRIAELKKLVPRYEPRYKEAVKQGKRPSC